MKPATQPKALFLRRHGFLPPASPQDLAILEGRAWGNSDFHPPGYAAFLAAVNPTDADPVSFRRRTGLAQFAGACLAVIVLFVTAVRHVASALARCAIAVLLGAQPWTFAYSFFILPDSLVATLTTLGLLALGAFTMAGAENGGTRLLVAGALLLGATFLLRPEMIVLAPAFGLAAIALRGARDRPSLLKSVACLAFVLGCFVAALVAYRVSHYGHVSVFNRYIASKQGAYDWVHTWFGTEHEGYDFVYGLGSGRSRLEDLPDRAFASASERETVRRALERVRLGGYSQEADAAFADLALRRVSEGWVEHFLLTRAWRTVHLWLNLETNEAVLLHAAALPRKASRVLFGGLLVLKAAVFLLAGGSAIAVVRRWRARALRPVDRVTLLMLGCVVGRTLFIGAAWGYMVHRYALTAWPAILWCACAGLASLTTAAGWEGSSPVTGQPPGA